VYVWDNVSTEDFKNFMFFDRFDMLILKISFKKYIYYFNAFPSKNHFEKQSIPLYTPKKI
jgi:hypothetical protein